MIPLTDIINEVLRAAYGVWGARYREHLITHDKERYLLLLSSGELYEALTQIEKAERLYIQTLKALENQTHTAELEQKAREEVERQLTELV